MIKEESIYKTRIEWKRAKPKDYNYVITNGMLEEICDRFGWEKPKDRKPIGYWTEERCIEDAKKYITRTEWRNNSHGAATAADRKGWREKCCEHMKILQKSWTLEECKKEAVKYKGRFEWQQKHCPSYAYAKTNKWLDVCCDHMEAYSAPNGYWNNKELILKEAKKYNYASDFEKANKNAYQAARYYGWYEEVTSHMDRKIKPTGYWNDKEKCKEAIKLCKSKEEIKKKYSSVSSSIIRNGWYDELTKHFDKRLVWTLELLKEEVKKYKTRSEFIKGSNGAYQVALKKGWMDILDKNLKRTTKPNGFWKKKENLISELSKFKSYKEFRKKCNSGYQYSVKYGWLDEIKKYYDK